MATSVTGVGSLNYTGVGAPNPPNQFMARRVPNSNDSQNVSIGDFWIANLGATQETWQLLSLEGGVATWVQLYPGAGGGATQFPTNSGTANEFGGMLNILGSTGITTSGSGDTVTINLSSAVAGSFPTDSGTAVPLGGSLNILGGANINTSAIGNTVSVALDTNVTIGGNLTLDSVNPGVLQASNAGVVSGSRGTNGQLLIGNAGINPAWANITSTDGSVVITNGTGSINLATSGAHAASIVTQSGTATPNMGVLNVNGTSVLNTSGSGNTIDINMTNGSDGQLIIGGGANPIWANLTSTDMSIVITEGANSIDLSAVGGGGGGNFEAAFSAYQATIATGVMTSSQTTYLLGSAVALTILTDVSGGFFEGDGLGSPASFTAPVSGTYYLSMKVKVFTNGSVTANPIVTIITPQGDFLMDPHISVGGSPGATQWQQVEVSCVVPLNLNDLVTFQVSMPSLVGSGGSTGSINGSASPYVTFVGGFLIKSGSTANAAFFATQTGNAANVTGRTSPETIYLMGSSAIMNATFNPGNNFFVGNGSGTACHYTAPATGLYQFNFTVVAQNSASSGIPPATLQIIAPGTTYSNFIFTRSSTSWASQGGAGISFSQCIPLTANDQVTFGVCQTITPANTTTIYATDPINSWNTGSPVTMISGYRVA